MRVLVIGFGSMGKRHAVNALALGHEVLVYDPALQHDDPSVPKTMGLYDRLPWERSPDATIIASPARCHAEHLLLAAANTNGPIFVEKPLGCSVSEFLNFGVTNRVHVGYMLRFHPGIQHLKELMFNELIKRRPQLAARVCVSVDGSSWPGTTYTDALLECSHELDLGDYLFGPADFVSASTAGENALWDISTDHGGVVIQTHLDTLRRGYERSIEVFSRESTMRWAWTPDWRWELSHHTAAMSSTMSGKTTPDDLYLEELKAFFAGDSLVPCGFREALRILTLCDTIRAQAYSFHP